MPESSRKRYGKQRQLGTENRAELSIDSRRRKKITRRKIGASIALFLSVMLLVLSGVYSAFRCYTTPIIEEGPAGDGSEAARYRRFADGMIAYGNNGITYYNADDEMVWTARYTVRNPQVEIAGRHGAMVDIAGNTVLPFDETGAGEIFHAVRNIERCRVRPDGEVAVLSTDRTDSYINFYQPDGTNIKEMRAVMDGGGIPLDFTFSPAGDRFAIVQLHVDGQSYCSNVFFYDFTTKSDNLADAKIADFRFDESMIPKIRYANNGEAFAFSDEKVYKFAEKGGEVLLSERAVTPGMSRIFIRQDGIYEIGKEDGASAVIRYDTDFKPRAHRQFQEFYTDIALTDDTMVLLNGKQMTGYTRNGFLRFRFTFDERIQAVEEVGRYEYMVVLESKVLRVKRPGFRW
ncbi:MAG: DUF5711 family protein [Eubacteriales bacterium]|nr:DUF5711 family protein [Eubacteriales bacterium]